MIRDEKPLDPLWLERIQNGPLSMPDLREYLTEASTEFGEEIGD